MNIDKQKELEERRARLSPEKQAILEQRLRRTSATVSGPEIPRRSESGPAALSYAQESLWFLEEFSGGFGAYNVPMLLRLRGTLDGSLLRTSLLGVIDRHESLRTRFNSSAGVPVQVVDAEGQLAWTEEDLTGLPAEALRRAEEEACRPFDLVEGPLVRATLYRLSSDEHLLCMVIHHIVFDGWSVGILLRELAACYEGQPLPSLPIRYADYAVWQRSRFQGEALERSLAYWKERLRDPLPVLELATDHARPAAQTFRGGQVCRDMSRDLTDRLRAFSQRESVTLFVTLLSGWAVLLHRYTGQEDIITGSGIAGRTRAELEGLIGFFVNTLALRLDLSGEPGFRTLLRRMQQLALEVYEHQETPFEALVAAIQPERDLSRSPLFQVMFMFQNTPAPTIQFSGVEGRVEEVRNGGAKFDLTCSIADCPEGLSLALEYNADLFEASTVGRMLEHYETLLAGATAQPEEKISALPLLTAAERKLVLDNWNATTRPYPRTSTLGALLAEQASLTPDNVAVEFEGSRVTYRELNGRANRLAHYLQGLGVGSEVMVGLCAERSLEMVVGTLAIIKAGGAYVPLDPEYPASRLSYMLEDTGAPVVLTQKKLLERLPSKRPRYVCLDDESAYADESEDEPESGAGASSLAYVMYTSGSTGQPKGVCVEHRNVVRLVKNTDYARFDGEVFLQLAPTSFDAATLEIWGPLLNGGRLVVYRPGPASLEELGTEIERSGITTLWLTSGLFHQMVEHQLESLRGIRQLMSGGDVLSVAHCRRVLETLPETTLINGYGPTECTTFTCCYPMKSVKALGETVSIGRPIANTRVYILDLHMEPVPVGVWGELYVGGDGVARGYLNSGELTAERFVPDPFSGNATDRLYRTGDVVRWLADGRIEFQGRMDFQVKLRGFRVELGEIESVLSRHECVGEAVVLAREDAPGDKRLVAYIVPRRGGVVDAQSLRTFMREQLPDYMGPSAFVALDAFPLTPNGKVNRRALPPPDLRDLAGDAGMVEPRTDIERVLADIWREVLKIDRLGIHDNFFFLGGHSMLAMRVMAQVRASLGVDLPLRVLFERPTIMALAQSVEAAKGAGLDGSEASLAKPTNQYHACVVALREHGTKKPLFCALGAGGVVYNYGALASLLDHDQPVYGLQYSELVDMEDVFQTVEAIASRYTEAIRTVQPAGPYSLAGWSFGGTVAFEVAQQLHRQGEQIAFLGMIDCGTNLRAGNPMRRLFEDIRMKMIRAWNRFLIVYYTRAIIWGYLRGMLRQIRPSPGDTGRRAPSLREYVQFIRTDIYRLYCMKQAGLAVPDVEENRLSMLQDSFIRGVVERLEANAAAQKYYVMKPYPGSVTLFRSRQDPYGFAHRDSTLGWSKIAAGGVDVHVIEGNHMTLVREPHVSLLAKALQECLDAVPR